MSTRPIAADENTLLQTPPAQSCLRVGYPEEAEGKEAKIIKSRWGKAQVNRRDFNGAPLTASVGLALSGGGIRSATFCLGILQGLAKSQQLREIDILSTVSGGGYIGSFLGRLFSRFREPNQTTSDIKCDAHGLIAPPAGRTVPVEVEDRLANTLSKEIQWLREHGRYVMPSGGGDVLAAGAHALRSWIALHFNLASLVFGIFCILATIRAFFPASIESAFGESARLGLWWSPWMLLSVIFAALVVIPLCIAFWLTQALSTQKGGGRFGDRSPLWLAILAVITLPILWWLTHVVILWLVLVPVFLSLAVFICVYFFARRAVRMFTQVGLFKSIRDLWNHLRARNTAQSAEGATFLRNIVSKSRNALTVWLGAALAGLAALLIIGIVDTLGQTLYVEWQLSKHQALAAGGVGGVTAIFALLNRYAGKLMGGKKSDASKAAAALIVPVLAILLAALYLVFWSCASHVLLWRHNFPAPAPASYTPPFKTVTLSSENYVQVRQEESSTVDRASSDSFLPAIGALVCIIIAGALRNNFGFLNLSSYQQLYAARLARAYFGASNPNRDSSEGKRISDPIPGDDCIMRDYQPHATGGPLHIINVTINETVSGSSQVEQRDRKGLPMAVGPKTLCVGVKYTSDANYDAESESLLVAPVGISGPNQFHVFGNKEHPAENLKLSNWIGISGAAFSTGAGSHTSLALSLLCGLANVRLGYWWNSGVDCRHRPGAVQQPLFARLLTESGAKFPLLAHLIQELTGQFHGPARQRWYLTDGGHFENTACYELLRRRVPVIVVCDCGADDEYRFEDLANLVRKARIDYDAEITFLESDGLDRLFDKPKDMTPEQNWKQWTEINPTTKAAFGPLTSLCRRRDAAFSGFPRGQYSEKHAAIATVRYDVSKTSQGPSPEYQSLIVVIKPSLTSDEPLDLLQYHFKNPAFPQEPTSDQFFDEAQWESYRKLGNHIGSTLFNDRLLLKRLMEAVHNQLRVSSPSPIL
jgi:hypothetical protein